MQAKRETPEIVLIAAVGEKDRVIGRGLELPWHLPADFRRFKALTLGHPLVMGRRTFASLLHQNGRPLPGRENVVLTHEPLDGEYPDVRVFSSLDAALAAFADRERIYIGGGAQVYAATLPLADRLELTLVEGDFAGDTFFPPYAHLVGPVFERVAVEAHPAEGGRPAFRFETFVRRAGAGGKP